MDALLLTRSVEMGFNVQFDASRLSHVRSCFKITIRSLAKVPVLVEFSDLDKSKEVGIVGTVAVVLLLLLNSSCSIRSVLVSERKGIGGLALYCS